MLICCRGCTRTILNGQGHYSLQDDMVHKMYTRCTGITVDTVLSGNIVKPADNLPADLCQICYTKLLEFNKFRIQCNVSVRLFQQWKTHLGRKTSFSFDVSQKYIRQPYYDPNNTYEKDVFCDVFELDPCDDSNIVCYKTIQIREKQPEVEPSVDEDLCNDDNDMQPEDKSIPEHSNENGLNDNEEPHAAPANIIVEEDDFEWPQEVPDDVLFAIPEEVIVAAPETVNCMECNTVLTQAEKKIHYDRWREEPTNVKDGTIPFYACDRPKCIFTSANQCSMTLHLYSHDNIPEGSQLCHICGKGFKAVYGHIRNTHDNIPRTSRCKICKKSMPGSQIYHHLTRVHNHKSRKYFCEICQDSFINRRLHMEKHSGFKRYKCSYCDAQFHYKTDYGDHLDIHTGDKRFHCRYCNEKMTRMQRRVHEKKCSKNLNGKQIFKTIRRGQRKGIIVKTDGNETAEEDEYNSNEEDECEEDAIEMSKETEMIAQNDNELIEEVEIELDERKNGMVEGADMEVQFFDFDSINWNGEETEIVAEGYSAF